MARGDKKVEHLTRLWMFSACTKKELATLARVAEEIHVPKGKVLTEEGATGHEFYLISDGEASVRRGGRKVATLGPGKYFGELSLLDRGPRTATVVAETDMDLVVLGQREFGGVLEEVPGMARKLLQAMAARLRESDARAYN